MIFETDEIFHDFKRKSKDNENVGEPFEVKCVKIIHRCLFPDTPWKDVVGRLERVDYQQYKNLVSDYVGSLPSIQFDKKMKLWDLPLRDILHKRASAMKFWDNWTKDEYDLYVFPIVDTPAVIFFYFSNDVYHIEDNELPAALLKNNCGGRYAIMNLADYMKHVFINEHPVFKDATLNLEEIND